eukprot:2817274-Rhodomonas_salina.2
MHVVRPRHPPAPLRFQPPSPYVAATTSPVLTYSNVLPAEGKALDPDTLLPIPASVSPDSRPGTPRNQMHEISAGHCVDLARTADHTQCLCRALHRMRVGLYCPTAM